MGQPRTKTVIKNGVEYKVELFDRGVIYINHVKTLITTCTNLKDIKEDISKAIDKYDNKIVSTDAWDKWDGKL